MELNFLLACELTPEILGLESQLLVYTIGYRAATPAFPSLDFSPSMNHHHYQTWTLSPSDRPPRLPPSFSQQPSDQPEATAFSTAFSFAGNGNI